MSARGGKRDGAGRKKIFDAISVMALNLRVMDLQRKNGRLSKKSALLLMIKKNEIPKSPVENYLRYLTPQKLSKKIRSGLANLTNREGIITTIRMSNALKYTPKKKVK